MTSDEAPIYKGKEVAARAKRGDKLNVSSVKGEWYGVIPAGGWVHKKHVEYVAISANGETAGSAGEGSALSAGKAVVAAIEAANKGNYEEANRLLDVTLKATSLEGGGIVDRVKYWDKVTKEKTMETAKLTREKGTDGIFKVIVKLSYEDNTSLAKRYTVKLKDKTWAAQ